MQDILVVEDGSQERERLNKLLSSADFCVLTAESASQAERLLTTHSFRMAILDIGLGDKSGSYLFEQIKRSGKITYIIILTGNPSVHLKQRFLDEGAAHYIVKGSKAAENDALLQTIKSLLGSPYKQTVSGIPLSEFLRQYITESSRQLFLDENNNIAPCYLCGSKDYIVTFGHKPQLPPVIEGKIVCVACNEEMNLLVK